jgi:hypothetical protein
MLLRIFELFYCAIRIKKIKLCIPILFDNNKWVCKNISILLETNVKFSGWRGKKSLYYSSKYYY